MEHRPGLCLDVKRSRRKDGAHYKYRTAEDGKWTWCRSGRWLPQVLYGYRHRRFGTGSSPFELMLGVVPCMDPSESTSLLREPSVEHRRLEILVALALSATRTDKQLQQLKKVGEAGQSQEFNVCDCALVALGQALTSVKWPASMPRFFGQCHIWKAAHPLCWLNSYCGRYSRRTINAKRIVPYSLRPMFLEN